MQKWFQLEESDMRVPKQVQKYLVILTVKTKVSMVQQFKYFATQKEAKAWASGQFGKMQLFKISYDFQREL